MGKCDRFIIVYLDGVDWLYHVDSDAFGARVFGDKQDLKHNIGHDLKECGIVKCKLVFEKWVKKPSKKMMGG